jgi:hypothetical protein
VAVSLWRKPEGVEFTRLIVGVISPTLIGTVGPKDTIGTDTDPARRINRINRIYIIGIAESAMVEHVCRCAIRPLHFRVVET